MNDLLRVLAEKLKGAELGSKAVAILVGLALLGTLGVTAVVSGRKHFELAFSGLSDHEVAEVNKALAEAGLSFEVSQPPSPFSVYVERDERSAAYRAVYGAGALDKPLKGILADSGVSSVFQGSEERLQSVRKREWQEMEGMLEVLDFVVSARVRTSSGSTSPLTGKSSAPMGASVTLRLAGGELGAEQAQTVAQLVSRGLGIEPDRIVISDQAGNQLFDGTEKEAVDQKVGDLLAHRERYDLQATEAANAVLAQTLGPGKARIAVRSEWDYDQSTVRTETSAGKATLVSEHKNTTETPLARQAAASNAAGIDSNVASDEGAPPVEPAPEEPLVSRTSEEDKEYQPSLKTEERVRFVPTLTRLSVAVFLDESLDAGLAGQLEGAIKAAVGFVEARDEFQSVRLPFAVEAVPEGAADGATPELPAEPNRMLELLLERGVEIAVSLVFVILLWKSLRGGRSKAQAESAAGGEPEIDAELLARARVEELLSADPEQVGSILSSWAKGEPVAGARS